MTALLPRHLFITGLPGSGKTTLLRRLVETCPEFRPAGFYTEEIREAGVRRGFRLQSLDGRTGTLAHVDISGSPRIGRYGVDISAFESFLADLALERSDAPLLFVDEIGKMECLSERFVVLMRRLLDSEKSLVATVAARGSGFIAEVKRRPDGCLEELRPEVREHLFLKLRVRLAEQWQDGSGT